MASFLCQVQTIQRAAGRSAVAAAAYRSGAALVDERLAMEFDFANKDGIEHAEIMAPETAPAALQDRERLWNAAGAVSGAMISACSMPSLLAKSNSIASRSSTSAAPDR